MREPAPWMKPSDDRILEYVQQAGEVTPSVIARNADLNRSYVSRRCGELTANELLESTGKGFYRITDEGKQYLAGELDATEQG